MANRCDWGHHWSHRWFYTLAQMLLWDSLGLGLLSQLMRTHLDPQEFKVRTEDPFFDQGLFLFQHKILYCFAPKFPINKHLLMGSLFAPISLI